MRKKGEGSRREGGRGRGEGKRKEDYEELEHSMPLWFSATHITTPKHFPQPHTTHTYLPLGVVSDAHGEGTNRTTVLANAAVGNWRRRTVSIHILTCIVYTRSILQVIYICCIFAFPGPVFEKYLITLFYNLR